jgi:Ser/Thr protein kinase RdoA (MazF antagonist)
MRDGSAQKTEGGASPVDLGALATPFAPLDEARAAETARRLYGLEGRLTRFATEKDDTFRLEDRSGGIYVLKIANPGEAFDELDLQVRLLRHLAARDPTLPVPRVFDDQEGRAISVLPGAGARRLVRLLSYRPGTVLDTVPTGPGERAQIGRLLARLRRALADFAPPAARRGNAWDARRLLALSPLLAQVGDATQRAALEAGLARFAAVAPRVERLRRQVLHNDFSRSNLIVDRNDPDFVTGIIDFGDALETAVAVDVSTALLNQLPADAAGRAGGDLFAEARDLLRGYLEIADLHDEERALIPHLVMARVVARALLTLWRARMFPANARYILRNTGPGWAQLDWFLARSADGISEIFL